MNEDIIALILVVLFYGSALFVGWRIEKWKEKEKKKDG